MLRDIQSGADPQVLAVSAAIGLTKPDIILLTRFDFDLDHQTLKAFSHLLSDQGLEFPYHFSRAPNSGVASGYDLDGDGYVGDATDAIGYGEFAGQGGMAVLSRFPIDQNAARDFSDFLWRDLPDNTIQDAPSPGLTTLPLSSVAHWVVPIHLADGSTLHLLAYHATTPAFDGPDDRNGRRNHDETQFWLQYLRGNLEHQPPQPPYIILGDANLDPVDGDGRHSAIIDLLDSGLVRDAEPKDGYGTVATQSQGGVNNHHTGKPAMDTADWWDTDGPGNLRVDYILPSPDLEIVNAGIQWPSADELAAITAKRGDKTSWHGLVWLDIRR